MFKIVNRTWCAKCVIGPFVGLGTPLWLHPRAIVWTWLYSGLLHRIWWLNSHLADHDTTWRVSNEHMHYGPRRFAVHKKFGRIERQFECVEDWLRHRSICLACLRIQNPLGMSRHVTTRTTCGACRAHISKWLLPINYCFPSKLPIWFKLPSLCICSLYNAHTSTNHWAATAHVTPAYDVVIIDVIGNK